VASELDKRLPRLCSWVGEVPSSRPDTRSLLARIGKGARTPNASRTIFLGCAARSCAGLGAWVKHRRLPVRRAIDPDGPYGAFLPQGLMPHRALSQAGRGGSACPSDAPRFSRFHL